MPSNAPKLTPQIQASIVAFIRAGGFPRVAAESAGVPAEVFDHWLDLAERPRAAKKYRDFASAVRQAAAHARLTAEIDTRAGKPLDWLRGGPGRPTPESDGWTGPARAPTAAKAAPLLTPEVQQMIAVLLEALADHPEARAAVGEALSSFSPEPAAKERRS